MTDDLLDTLRGAARAVARALGAVDDWRPQTERAGQYGIDLVADEAAVEHLRAAGLGVLSEESGVHDSDRAVIVVLDPVDGSTNASRGLPWWNTSLCAVDDDGPLAAVVVNQASGEVFEATRGGGARRQGQPVQPSGCRHLDTALVGLSGFPASHWGWRQFRALGAAALDLCTVAAGGLDAYADAVTGGHHAPWDYCAGLLICREAGAVVADADGRDLVVLDHGARRAPVAAATPELLDQLLSARNLA